MNDTQIIQHIYYTALEAYKKKLERLKWAESRMRANRSSVFYEEGSIYSLYAQMKECTQCIKFINDSLGNTELFESIFLK